MSRKRMQLYNSISSLVYQVLLIIYSFIMPRLYLIYFGSEINGLISSITQFLSVISLMDMGVGAVIQYNFYEPLAIGDRKKLNELYNSASTFFRKVVLIYLFYLMGFILVYPKSIGKGDVYTITLIFILAINLIAEYLFGVTNQYLLCADQKNYIIQIVSILLLVINCIISILLITSGLDIRAVKLVYAIILLIKPIFLTFYVRTNYSLDRKIVSKKETIQQKWNAMIQHFAFFVTTSTDVMVITMFSNLTNVSVYYVYNLVANGMKQIISSLMTGMDAMFGNMFAKKEINKLSDVFLEFEWIMHFGITILFSCTASLITSFVMIYTKNVTDADYFQPIFGITLTVAICLWCFRTIYYILVKAAGKYKETQISSIIEMILNVGISIIGIKFIGLVGVALGTLISMLYRTCYLAHFIQKIINYRFVIFLKRMMVDTVVFIFTLTLNFILFGFVTSLVEWMIVAILTLLLSILISLVINVFVDKKYITKYIRKILKKIGWYHD